MAVVVTSGDLKYKVVFKQPVSSLNSEGGIELDYTTTPLLLSTWADVRKFNIRRTTDSLSEVLIGSLDFYIRSSDDREDINKDWIIEYGGEDYTIHEIDPYAVDGFIRFTAKVRTDG